MRPRYLFNAMAEDPYCLEVALDKPLYHLFTYKSPVPVTPGTRVKVPFQRHTEIGIVVRQSKTFQENQAQKPKFRFIEKVLDNRCLFSEKWLNLMRFTATYYLYPIGQTFFTALPKELKTKDNLSFPKPMVRYRLNSSGQQATPPKRAGPLLNLWQTLQKTNISAEEAAQIHPRGRYYLQKYLQAGYLDCLENEQPPSFIYQQQYPLNKEQQKASNAIGASLNLFKVFLLFGITGSGKSEVYFEAMYHALKQGKQVLMLLPVINLTPQFFERLQKHFPTVPIAVLHSKIPAKKRLHNYLTALNGEAKIIIGTRLCIFTPIENLGLIIVDEEQDESFKQESELRYNARDLAIWRGKQVSCPVVLGSATPSLESWYQMEQGKYQLLTLKERAGSGSSLPRIEFIDIHHQKLKEGFASLTLEAIHKHLVKNEVVLLYLNRRGFATTLVCLDCGKAIKCIHCSANMVYHRRLGLLKCHHCENEKDIPECCAYCGNVDLTPIGLGTERVEQSIKEHFPESRIVRVDSDSMTRQKNWENTYQDIQKGEVDLLIGTQILAKGHDFKDLNLVVVLNADSALFSADFRAAEKLFSELMQVAGRAGRNSECGLVLIQTQFPNHPLFTALKHHDYLTFATTALKERLELDFPPKTHRIALKAEEHDLSLVEAFLIKVKKQLFLPESIRAIGPLAMTPFKVADRFRSLIYLESEARIPLHQVAKSMLFLAHRLKKSIPTVRWSIDVDPHEF